jgi:hypothetical protein
MRYAADDRSTNAELTSESLAFFTKVSASADLVGLRAGQLGISSALLIYRLGYRLEVRWVDAIAIATEVVDLESLVEVPDKRLIVEARRLHNSTASGIPHACVSLLIARSEPRPARCRISARLNGVTLIQGSERSLKLVMAADESSICPSLVALGTARGSHASRSLPASAFAKFRVRIFRHIASLVDVVLGTPVLSLASPPTLEGSAVAGACRKVTFGKSPIVRSVQ